MRTKRIAMNEMSIRRFIATISFIMILCAIGQSPFARQNPHPAKPSSETREARVAWLQEHAAPIRSVEPNDTDFTDLAPLGQAVASARVVMLGEQSHGDGTVFLAKTRMIRYLHEKLGFDVLVFESGLYDMAKAWSYLQHGEEPIKAIGRGIFGIWNGSQEFQPLIDYIAQAKQTDHPLELAGCDDQFSATASHEFFRTDLRLFLDSRRIDMKTMAHSSEFWPILDVLIERPYDDQKIAKDRQTLFFSVWDEICRRVNACPGHDAELAYRIQLLRSTRMYAKQVFDYDPNKHVNGAATNSGARDAQMADNLLWLVHKRYPGRKLIIWAATDHITKNPTTIVTNPPGGYAGFSSMGHIVAKELGNQSYAIGFIASEGQMGIWKMQPRELAVPDPSSLEGLFSSTTFQNAFLDLRIVPASCLWLHSPILSGPLGYSPFTADWSKVLDGIIYTRVMKPSTKATR
jgi:erythromycin esterase